jgi:hypothetical protein
MSDVQIVMLPDGLELELLSVTPSVDRGEADDVDVGGHRLEERGGRPASDPTLPLRLPFSHQSAPWPCLLLVLEIIIDQVCGQT